MKHGEDNHNSKFLAQKAQLESILDEGYRDIEFENTMMSKVVDRCLPYVVGPRVLCLGYAGDDWPDKLERNGFKPDIVEGAKSHYEMARKDFSDRDISVFYNVFEEFAPCQAYDTVVAGSVIEFFDDPSILMSACRRFLRPGGRLICTTPNALSIHRRLGVILGIESSPLDINEPGKAGMARHAFTPYSLIALC